jgi:putative CocE/NonD family hydrolase
MDQRPVESRPDVLVYTSGALKKDVEATGPVRVVLYASTSAPDTDFTAKLVDVRPNGYAQNLAEGVVRARFRDSLSAPKPITPGRIYQFEIDMWATSHLVSAGHRIRLEISSSNFPRFDRNPNTGRDLFADAEMRPALQTVMHDRSFQSHLTLPVIPARR